MIPRPSNLAESREIMRLLSQFGEVEYFRSLKYDAASAPGAALVIYKDADAAKECLKRSPIRFRMGRASDKPRAEQQVSEGDDSSYMEAAPSSLPSGSQRNYPSAQSRGMSTSPIPTPPHPKVRMPFDQPPPADPPRLDQEDSRMFQIITNRSVRNFRDHINAGAYHGNFGLDPKSPGQEDLARKVPYSGLSCVNWKAVDRPWRVIAQEKQKSSTLSLGQMARRTPSNTTRDIESASSDRVDIDRKIGTGKDGRLSQDDTLDTILKGWESMFPGGSDTPPPTQRYSRKPK